MFQSATRISSCFVQQLGAPRSVVAWTGPLDVTRLPVQSKPEAAAAAQCSPVLHACITNHNDSALKKKKSQ